MNILGVFILTLIWGLSQATTYPQRWNENQSYHQLSGVPDRILANQHLPPQKPLNLPEGQRFYQNWLGNNRSPQIAKVVPIQYYNNVNSLPLRPRLNEEPYVITAINEPYNLPHQNRIQDFVSHTNLGLNDAQNIPVLQEPYRQNIDLRDIVLPQVKYIQQTPESISYPERNQEVSNTPLRQKFGVQQIFANPKILEVINAAKQTKRYMVIYPDGTVSHADNIDVILKSNPDHVLISSKDLLVNRNDQNIRQTENNQEVSKEVSNEKVAKNPIDIILNETIPKNNSKPKKISDEPNHANQEEITTTQKVVQNPIDIILNETIPKNNSKPKKVSDKPNHVNQEEITTTQKDAQNPIDIILNGTIPKNNSKPKKEVDSNHVLVIKSIVQEPSISQKLVPPSVRINNVNNSKQKSNLTKNKVLVDSQSSQSGSNQNSTNIKPIDSSNQTFVTFNTSYLRPYTDSMIRENKNKASKKINIGQNLIKEKNNTLNDTTVTLNISDLLSSPLLTKRVPVYTVVGSGSKQNISVAKLKNVPIFTIDNILPILNDTEQASNGRGNDESKNLIKPSSPKSEKKLDSKTLKDKSNAKDVTTNHKPSLENIDDGETEKNNNSSSLDQSEKDIISAEIDNSTISSEDSVNNTQEDVLEDASFENIEFDNSSSVEPSLSSEERDTKYDFNFSSEQRPIDSSEDKPVTSDDDDLWHKAIIKNNLEGKVPFDLPLQPITIVDSTGENHECVRLLDPLALLTYIVCQ